MNYKKIIKRLQVINAVLVALLIMLVGSSLAIYTSQVYQRAVVRNRYNDVIRFSSDKLLRVSEGTYATQIYYPVAENQTSMSFTVCNFDQSKSTLVHEMDIKYTITFSFENQDEDYAYSISCNNNNIDTLTSYVSTLKGGIASVDTYTVNFSSLDYQNLKLTVTVTPDDLQLTKKNILTATFIPIQYGTTQQFQVHMEFPDSLRIKGDGLHFTPEDVDAYNVLVSVTGGNGNVIIKWNPVMVELDPYFSSRYTIDEKSEKEYRINLPMNSADDTASYLIPFYNPDTTVPGWTDWDQLKAYIQVDLQ